MEPSNIFDYLQDHVKRKLLSFIIILPFWVVPFFLFKKPFFEFPIYVQISFIFCLALGWYIINVFTVLFFLHAFLSDPEEPDRLLPELITFSCVSFLSVFTLYGYYNSVDMNRFLIISYVGIILVTLLFGLVFFIKSLIYKYRR